MELWTKFLTIILVAICGGIIQRVTGFGFGIFAMMFLPHIVGGLFGSASLMSNLLATFMTAFVAFRHRKYIQWRIILPCLGASLITTSIAVAFMKKTENDLIHIGNPIPFDTDQFLVQLKKLMDAAHNNDEHITKLVEEIVPTYHPAQGGAGKKDATYEKLCREAVGAK